MTDAKCMSRRHLEWPSQTTIANLKKLKPPTMKIVTMQCLSNDDDIPETPLNEDDDHAPETPPNEDADVAHDRNRFG